MTGSMTRAAIGTGLSLLIAAGVATTTAAADRTYASEQASFKVVTLAEGLEHPWALAFLPDGGILITERPGRLRLFRDGALGPPIAGVPAVEARNQGGLLDVALDPGFAQNRLVYLSYAAQGFGGAATAVARGRFAGDRLDDVQEIFQAEPASGGGRHFGSRLVFAPDGTLYVTAGERGSPNRAQDVGDDAGAVHRLNPDGGVPADNPLVGQAGARPTIYSYGHRNPQGMTLHPETGAVWTHEHGPRGGDEVNILQPGVNYGWPVITYGISYGGQPIGEGNAKPGMAQPLLYWVPSIAPSGMAFYTGDKFPEWRGDLFVGALVLRHLRRVELDGETVVGQEELLKDLRARIRDVRNGPDGYIYLLTDASSGALLRLEPAD